ncbi:acyl-CoA carboxylase subunit beta [Bradyrhizobium australafricanum]|uniref:acyl-CoA carboxylase subunit beta n=1 Tax=Bradyrhizobium australafricanum TaxID=2821406 RepID=UPI001CE23472|nr:carboxyl transferase domain-containing protein [Bradyrhizobium australafricanum]MCA6100499.1 propionyl-CoA carboxylase [Bradyrhizobium australafricanum]
MTRDVPWQERAVEIDERRRLAKLQGGEEAVRRQHDRGKLTIRERVLGVVDPGSFSEVGPIAGAGEVDENGKLVFTPANFVLGIGRINSRHCVVGGEDFTMGAGSPNPAGLRKSIYTEELALHYRLPLVRLHEGSGASITGSGGKNARTLPEPVYATNRFESIARCLGTVPVVSAAVGAVAGLPAGRLAGSHYALMTRSSQIMSGGPALVERALGIKLTKEELGGPDVHARSGLVDDIVEDEQAAFDTIRRFLSYLPQNVWELAPKLPPQEPSARASEGLESIVPANRRRTYDVRRIIEGIFDHLSFFEMGRRFGPGQVTGFARLAGQSVGVFANDARQNAGSLTAAGAQKLRRFVDLCQLFHLPIVTLVDEPGFMIGPEAEAAATIRYGAAALAAVALSTVPWASVVIRKAMGLGAYAHRPSGTYQLSWPSAESGALPVEGGVAIAFKREIESAPDAAAKRAELEDQFASLQSPFRQAEAFSVHDIIHPRETRDRLIEWLGIVSSKLAAELGPPRFSYRP